MCTLFLSCYDCRHSRHHAVRAIENRIDGKSDERQDRCNIWNNATHWVIIAVGRALQGLMGIWLPTVELRRLTANASCVLRNACCLDIRQHL